ncbi:MAG: TIGR01777 family oxidoreductase [Acidobacteriota bacterium]
MHTLIAGGTGFLGRALAAALTGAGHDVTVLTRRAGAQDGQRPFSSVRLVRWDPDGGLGPWARSCGSVDCVINLAGESIAARRWTDTHKAILSGSRILSTRSLVAFVRQASPHPSLFVSASAIGYYGEGGDKALDEQTPSGGDFLSRLVADWEQEARRAESASTRVAMVRTGIVLDPREGALAKMLTPFRLGAGGRFGSGRQYMSWIHRDDWLSLLLWLLGTPGAEGPYNATAPAPVTNAAFVRTLGSVLGRPAIVPVPRFALKLALGEMAGPLLLFSQRVLPIRATAGGFTFRFPELEPALRDLIG